MMNRDTVGKAVCSGAIAGSITRAYKGPVSVTIPILGNQRVPLALAGAGVGAASSLVADAVHSYILPSWSVDDKFDSTQGAVLALASSGGTTAAIYACMDDGSTILRDMGGGVQVALLGAASEWAGAMAWGWIKPLV